MALNVYSAICVLRLGVGRLKHQAPRFFAERPAKEIGATRELLVRVAISRHASCSTAGLFPPRSTDSCQRWIIPGKTRRRVSCGNCAQSNYRHTDAHTHTLTLTMIISCLRDLITSAPPILTLSRIQKAEPPAPHAALRPARRGKEDERLFLQNGVIFGSELCVLSIAERYLRLKESLLIDIVPPYPPTHTHPAPRLFEMSTPNFRFKPCRSVE